MEGSGKIKFTNEILKFVGTNTQEAKLRELLRNITSIEIKLCSEASKRFIKLLKSESGGELLQQYIQASSKCSEITGAWKLRRGKPGMSYITSLVATILSHPDGKYKPNCVGSTAISRELDKFAQLIIEDMLDDIYKELNSKKSKRQSAALLLLASIVRRGSGLASELAKLFDFKLSTFSKLAVCKQNQNEKKTRHSTRVSFVGFAMSFLEVGKPGLLRWILQQREMYSSVLRGLGHDDDETVSYVLSTLRDRVLIEESSVSPSLRSVLFGNVTLEQLLNICLRENSSAQMAYSILVMVCTDPCNGIMPDENRVPTPLKGNPKRLLSLMKKLRAIEVGFHNDLLLAIINGKPHFAAAYMDEFPYNLEDHKSNTWFDSISFAAKLISSVRTSLPSGFLDFPSHVPPSLNYPHVQYIMKCAYPHHFSKSVVTKGLLHSDFLVKHGTLRLLLESLYLLDSVITAIKFSSISNLHAWIYLKQEFEDNAQISLPDPQVLLSLLSSLNTHRKDSQICSKRAPESKIVKIARKKSRSVQANENKDILVGGLCSVPEYYSTEDFDKPSSAPSSETSDIEDYANVIIELWQLKTCSLDLTELKDFEMILHSRLLDAVKLYHRIIPGLFERSFDFFKILPRNLIELPAILQESILSLLIEYIGWCPNRGIPTKALPLMYKHLHPFIDLLLSSPIKDIKDQAKILARAAMLSTGAFEKKSCELCLWFYFLSGYISVEDKGVETFLSVVPVVSFLCDVVSSVGNNLFKYLDKIRCCVCQLRITEGEVSPDFSPLTICALDKCLRLLSSESGAYTQIEKFSISLYVSSTLGYILQTQVQDGLLSSLINFLLLEKFEGNFDGSQDMCEWRPLKKLLIFSQDMVHRETCCIFSPGLESLLGIEAGNDDPSKRSINCLSSQITQFRGILVGLNSAVFASFLKMAPFYNIFPVLMNFDGMNLLGYASILDILLAKILDLRSDHFVSSIGLILFSINQIQLSYRTEPTDLLEKLSEICHVLMGKMLKILSGSHLDSMYSTTYGAYLSCQEVLDLSKNMFSHSAVMMSLAFPLRFTEEFIDNDFLDVVNVLNLCKERINRMDSFALKLLENVFDCVLLVCNGQGIVAVTDECSKEQLLKAMRCPVQKIILKFKGSFDLCLKNKDMVPHAESLYCLYILIHYISPFELLNIVEWMFNRVDMGDISALNSIEYSAYSVGFFIACCALETLSCYMQHSNIKKVPYDCIWGLTEASSYIALFERIFYKACEISIHLRLHFADVCLLRAVDFLRTRVLWQYRTLSIHLNMVMCRVIMNTPLEILTNCVFKTSMTKSEILFLLVEWCPLHLSMFAQIFLRIPNNRLLPSNDLMTDTCNNNLSDEDFLMILPAALSLVSEFGEKFYHHFKSVSSYYSRILFDGFVNWKSFVSKHIFQMDTTKFSPSSMEEVIRVIKDSLLGKSTQMLRHHLVFNADIMTLKTRLKLFSSICAWVAPDDVLEYDIGEIGSYTFSESLNFVNRVVAKISICRMLLFLEDNHIQSSINGTNMDEKEILSKKGSNEVFSRIHFITLLVNAWQLIIDKFPLISNDFQLENGSNVFLFKFLEVHILKNISELIPQMHCDFIQSNYFPLEKLAKSSLLHRFEDPITLRMLHTVLSYFSECKFSHSKILELLLAHSQFVPTIHSISKSLVCTQIGPLVRPMSSILGSLIKPISNIGDSKENIELSAHDTKRLEIIKLLRGLYCSYSDFKIDHAINLKELFFLLLSSYGATLSEVDLEIFELMHEIEFCGGLDSGNIAEMDYLWGSSSVKLKNDSVENLSAINGIYDVEADRERRKNHFRENLPIDPKMCAATVLYFPYDRTVENGPFLWKNVDCFESHYVKTRRMQLYDPVFILRFSIHSLSMGYLEPFEFASLGLISVVFISISSQCDGIRKLGYEALGRFKNALEKYRRKDLMRLRLLLTYLQNGIEEPMQQIPSIAAVFAAEASFILLDPSHGHYSTINKLLMCSHKSNFKSVPLFSDFFWSSSIDFKAERLWILRLLFVSLNYDRDAQICIKDSIFEMLLCFYISPLSDNDSKELILLIVKKSVRFQRAARHLVEHRGLLPWLSSIVSRFDRRLCTDPNSFSLIELTLAVEVLSNVIAFKDTILWLKDNAFEQLSEFASYLYKLLVDDLKLIGRNVTLVNRSLQVVVSTLKISQERKIHQTHFTISCEGLFRLFEAFDACDNGKLTPSSELSLTVILMCTPSGDLLNMDREKLSKFIMWSISIAVQSDSSKFLQSSEFQSVSANSLKTENSLTLILLRWLIASIVLRSLSAKSSDFDYYSCVERPGYETLKIFLDDIKKQRGANEKSGIDCESILAHALLYLRQALRMKCCVLPSLVCGLLLLHLLDDSYVAGSGSDVLVDEGDDDVVIPLLSRIRGPSEANSSWRWSFNEAWDDLSLKKSDSETMDELHACHSLLLISSKWLGKESIGKQHGLQYKDVQDCGAFDWETSLFEN